jgi:type II secretion system protein J
MTSPRLFSSRPRAFTLIEVLIAVAAFAIVLAAINSVFYSALRLRNKAALAVEEALPREHALAIIKRDLANLAVPGGILSGQLQTTVTKSLPDQVSPDFYTSSGLVDETSPWAEVQRVCFALAESTNRNGSKELVRGVTRNLLPVAGEELPARQWLMSGVQSVAFLFHDGAQWRDSWDSTTPDPSSGRTNNLPKAIKVQIQLVPERSGRAITVSAPIELVVPVNVQAPTNRTNL